MGLMPTKFWKVDWKRVSNSVHLGFFWFFFMFSLQPLLWVEAHLFHLAEMERLNHLNTNSIRVLQDERTPK